MTTYEAVIFDMDGVLADSEPVYYDIIRDMLEPLGHEVTEAHQRALMGSSTEYTWQYLKSTFGLEGSLDEIVQTYDADLQRRLATIHEPLPGIRELIDALKQRGVRIAVASSSLPAWIEALLGGLNLDGAFDAVVSATMVEHPKPAPDIYLEAARRLGVLPEHCIAIEDTPTGLASAKAAGMLTVQVRASSMAWPPQDDAAIVLETLQEFDLGLIEAQ